MPPEREYYFKYQLENKRALRLKNKYDLLKKNWQQLLIKEVAKERELMEKDKVIIALQERIKRYERGVF